MFTIVARAVRALFAGTAASTAAVLGGLLLLAVLVAPHAGPVTTGVCQALLVLGPLTVVLRLALGGFRRR